MKKIKLSDYAWESFPHIPIALLLFALGILLVFGKLRGPDYRDWIPLVASTTGGLFTAIAAILAVHVAHRRTIYREQLVRRERVEATMQSLLVEMKLFWAEYSRSIGAAVESVPPEDGLQIPFIFWENPFPIYEANCVNIGNIPGVELREAIVTSYFAAYTMLSSIRNNTEIVVRMSGRSNALENADNALRLKGNFADIRRLHNELCERAPRAIKLLENALEE